MIDADADDETFLRFNYLLETTLLLKLTHNYDDMEKHREYSIRNCHFSKNMIELREFLRSIDLFTHKNSSEILASLLILCKELGFESKYNPSEAKDHIKLLNSDLETQYGVSLDNLLITGDKFDSQSIFDSCMEKLHQRLTPTEFKKYPFLIEVYLLIINDLKTYNITVIPSKTLPISLIFIDDYMDDIKRKGLKSFITILQCADENCFSNGNYHEVIYKCLCKAIKAIDPQLLGLALECLNEYLKALPNDLKKQKTNDILYMILNILQMDTLPRKKEFIKFIKPFISIDVLKRQKVFERVMVDNLDQCTIDSTREVLLMDLLDCIQLWLKHCWCVWSYPSNHKLLSVLIKVLFVISKDETNKQTVKIVEDLIVTMTDLSEIKHRQEIIEQLKLAPELNNQVFKEMISNKLIVTEEKETS